ncbi:hypothetical protein WHR41_07480 [Cladosporium halotolerans]|uniref:Uncharacterized protein n=1 Tax=Cladosporium halotolerans TaxID=1052096 RepID=A0AB34KL68_9PEZI
MAELSFVTLDVFGLAVLLMPDPDFT